MNTITQIYDEHASMPPHGETKKNQKIWLIIYCTTVNMLRGEYMFSPEIPRS